jgi:AraC family transcriptional regulator
MTTAADQFDDTPSSTDLEESIYLAKLSRLLETAKRELELDREAAMALLARASSILQSEIERRSRAKGTKPSALAPWQTARLRSFIDENLHRTISANDLSAVAQRSTSHFSRSFKRAFGEPPHAYVVRRRLERACHLMITSSTSLSEIALRVGFSDQAHLSRLFRRAFGQSPSSWRRNLESRREPIRQTSSRVVSIPITDAALKEQKPSAGGEFVQDLPEQLCDRGRHRTDS